MDVSRATILAGLLGLVLAVLEADVAVFWFVAGGDDAGGDDGVLLSHATKSPEQSNNPVSVIVFRDSSAGAIRLTRQGYG